MVTTQTKPDTEKQFGWLTSAMKKVGSEAQLNVAGHLRAVTGGRHFLLANYHKDDSIPAETKSALYKAVFSAIAGVGNNGKPDWSKLQGQQGNGSKRVDPIDVVPAPVARIADNPRPVPPVEVPPVEVVEVPPPVKAPVKAVEAEVEQPITPRITRKQPAAEGDSEVADLLAKLLNGRIAASATVDESAIEAIADKCARTAVAEARIDLDNRFDNEFESKLRQHMGNGSFPTDRVKALIDEAMEGMVKRVSITLPSGEAKDISGLCHELFPTLLKMAAARVNLLITGPTGSGKTHAAEKVAKALDLPFYYNGAIDTEYKLKGFIDAGGKLISPAFRKAWQNGGVYCFDEVDASLPPAVLSFNGALSNHLCDFPDGMIERHKDCIILATGNTWLGGATFDYVGRMKQDAAFADRFATLYWGVDEKLERALCSNLDWVKFVQAVRANVVRHGLKVIVSPRATFNGEKLLAAGLDRDDVIRSCVRKGMTNDQWNQINPGNITI